MSSGTADRLLDVSERGFYSLKKQALTNCSRVKRLMVAVSLMAVIFSLPRFFEVEAICLLSDVANSSCLPTVARTELTQVRYIVLPSSVNLRSKSLFRLEHSFISFKNSGLFSL